MTLNYLGKLKTLDFNFIYYLVLIIGFIAFPELAYIFLIYGVMFLLTETLQKGMQASKTSLLRGVLVFLGVSVVSYIFFSNFEFVFAKNKVVTDFSVTALIMLCFVIANTEEEIYRNILVKYIGSPVIAIILYTLLHIVTGLKVLGFEGSALYSYLGFTFIFGSLMYFLKANYKYVEIPKGIHFVFLLFNYGYNTLVGGLI